MDRLAKPNSIETGTYGGSLNVGETITLKKGVPVLLGQSSQGVDGHVVYTIAALASNQKISAYGVSILFDGQGINILKPKLLLDGGFYTSTNKVIVKDLLGKKERVEDKYGEEGKFTNFENVFVGDEEADNGFIMEPVGNDRISLKAVINKG